MEIPLHKPFIDENEEERVKQVLRDGWISTRGDAVEEFERKIADFTGVENAIAVDSGTAALQLILEALEIGRGDQVLVPDFTFGSIATAIKAVGAEPVPVDIERETLGIDPAEIGEAVTQDAEAVLAAHMFGKPAKVEEIKDVAEDHGLKLIEDAAQAFGSEYAGKKTGSFGDAGYYSFSWNKTITTGKGGMVLTDSDETAEKMKGIADYGRNTPGGDRYVRSGYNFRMDNIRASLGLAQFDNKKSIMKERQELADSYQRKMGREEVELPGFNIGQEVPWSYYVRSGRAADIAERLESRGIGYMKFYGPLHLKDVIEISGDFPVSESISERGLVLPFYPEMEEQDVETVCNSVKESLKKY
ncbi:MAG: DegT/DnrJ/EryC1/StrS family aminotransferase [Candidatus Nanohaloarchaea archaeon]